MHAQVNAAGKSGRGRAAADVGMQQACMVTTTQILLWATGTLGLLVPDTDLQPGLRAAAACPRSCLLLRARPPVPSQRRANLAALCVLGAARSKTGSTKTTDRNAVPRLHLHRSL